MRLHIETARVMMLAIGSFSAIMETKAFFSMFRLSVAIVDEKLSSSMSTTKEVRFSWSACCQF